MSADAVVITTTVDERTAADRLATGLVEARLAACVQVLGPIHSTYRWRGAIQRAEEWLLLVKTTREHWADVADHIHAHHPYDVPELIATPVVAADPAYLDWLAASVGGGSRGTSPAGPRSNSRSSDSGDVHTEVDRDAS